MATDLTYSPAPVGAINVQQLPDGSWTWQDPATGIVYVKYADVTDPVTGEFTIGRTVALAAGQSITDPALATAQRTLGPTETLSTDVPVPAADTAAANELQATLQGILDGYGLNTPGMTDLLNQALTEGWSATEFVLKLREHPDYLANPLFKANMDRAAAGEGFWTEEAVLKYAADTKALARSYGFEEPSDDYIAAGFANGKSVDEFAHILEVQETVNTYGGGVAQVFSEIMGYDPSDQDLWELFSDEVNTSEIDKALQEAEIRGRPLSLGLGIRSEAEAQALIALGVSPDEAFARYSTVAENAGRFAKYQAIEDSILQGLPDDFGLDLSTQENSLLMKAFLMPGTIEGTEAFTTLQEVLMREAARWKQGGVTATQGQLVGLLNQEQKQSYG